MDVFRQGGGGRVWRLITACLFLMGVATVAVSAEQKPGATITRLHDGQVLVIGGEVSGTPTTSAQWSSSDKKNKLSTAALIHPRAWHTATLLPNGRVLVVGGVDVTGASQASAEIFRLDTGEFIELPSAGFTARARHTATLLNDGMVLIAGGVGTDRKASDSADLFDFRTGTVEPISAALVTARYGHVGGLSGADAVVLRGGFDDAGEEIDASEQYMPDAQSFTHERSTADPATNRGAPTIVATAPRANAVDVAVDSLISVRFSRPLDVTTLNASTVTVLGAEGNIALNVVGTENGQLLFVTSVKPLLPSSSYTVFIDGVRDGLGQAVAFAAFGFTTAAIVGPRDSGAMATFAGASATGDAATWRPDAAQFAGGAWHSGRRDATFFTNLPPLKAKRGVTALAGQVLLLDGNPLPDVAIEIGDVVTRTDNTGRFLLEGVAAGHQVLVIDGATANQANKQYAIFTVGVDVAPRVTTALKYTVWMPRIDEENRVRIPSPTTKDTVVTTSAIPGLELHIPKGTVIRDRHGKIVTEIGFTPIPVDRPPFPLPNTSVPVYFTVQPGGAHLINIASNGAQGARLYYPNYHNARSGAKIDFWNYDAYDKGWYVYGQGTVANNAAQVVPDPGVAIYEFTGAMISFPGGAPASGPPPGGCSGGTSGIPGVGCGSPSSGGGCEGDPVDCATGLFLHQRTDLYLDDVIPLQLTRTYRTNDGVGREFGIGWNFPYGIFLTSGNLYNEADLILPDGGRIHYVRTSPGSQYEDAVFEHVESAAAGATPTSFYRSTIAWNGNGWDLALRNGWTYVFGDTAGLQSIRDPNGNSIKLTRLGNAQSGLITRLTSPNGKWIEFTYNGPRIAQAKDVLGRTVKYDYDAYGRLWKVTNPIGGIEEYSYYEDGSHRMRTVKDLRGNTMVSNEYDAAGRVQKQTMADGGVYMFAYTTDANGKITRTDVTDPRAFIHRMNFSPDRYLTSETYALGKPEAQTITYEREAGTNRILRIIDALGRKTRYQYSAYGSVSTETSAEGTIDEIIERYTYTTDFQRVKTYTNGLGKVWTLNYDGKGNVRFIIDPLLHQTELRYNAVGQLEAILDALGNATTLGYDSGVLATIMDPLGRTVRRFSDAAGRVKSVLDALGNRTRYDYDDLDRLTKITDALGYLTQFGYDANGNVETVRDAKGNVTTHTYYAKNTVQTRQDALTRSDSYVYDKNNNLTRHTDRNGKVHEFVYDGLNRLTSAKYGAPAAGGTPESTVTYTYEGPQLKSITDTAGPTVAFVYDNLGRVTSETQGSNSVTYTYDAAHRRKTMTVAGQAQISYAYDDANRLTKITQGTANVALTYDDANRRRTLTLPNGVVLTYGYDTASQLKTLTYKKGTTAVGDLAYTYDNAGRRTKVTGSLSRVNLPAALGSATYNANNQLTNWGGTLLGYDNNGNLKTEGAATYTWDSRNRLKTTSAGTGSFTYDALNRRTKKILGGTTQQYVYDGANPVQERNGSNAVTANLLTGLNIDEVFRRTEGTTPRDFITDALGSAVALTNASGVVQTSYTYEPYGKTTTTGTTNSNPFQYTGRENDGASGLYFYRNRYYQPTYGRFVSEDPIGFGGGDASLYRYVKNNPIQYMDPHGLWLMSVEFYTAGGGGVRFGRDPTTGQGFLVIRLGYGAGGGITYDPNGGRPGGSSASGGATGGVTLGGYGNFGGTIQVGGVGGSVGIEGEIGRDFGAGTDYAGGGPSGSLGYEPGGKTGIGLGGGIGLEVGFYGRPGRPTDCAPR